MSDAYPPKRAEEYTGIEMFRRVYGAESVIDQMRGLAEIVLSKEVTGQMPFDGEYHTIGYRYCNVRDASDLRLEMYKRRDTPEMRPESRFSSLKRKLANGYTPKKQTNNRLNQDNRAPLSEGLDRIQFIDHGVGADDLEVHIVGIAARYASDIKNGHYELVFLPDIATKVGRMLLDQARYMQERVAFESRRVAYPTNADILTIPFASVRKVPEEKRQQENDLHAAIRGKMPVTVGIGPVVIK